MIRKPFYRKFRQRFYETLSEKGASVLRYRGADNKEHYIASSTDPAGGGMNIKDYDSGDAMEADLTQKNGTIASLPSGEFYIFNAHREEWEPLGLENIDETLFPKVVGIDFMTGSDTVQWTNAYARNAHVTYMAGNNIASVKVSYGSVRQESHQLGAQNFTVADGDTLTLTIVRTSEGQDANLSVRFVLSD